MSREEFHEPLVSVLLSGLGWCVGGAGMLGCGLCCSPYKQIDRGFKGIIQRFGRVRRIVNEGLYMVNPITESMRMVDVRCQLDDLSKQTVITKDNLNLIIDGVVYFTILDVMKATFGVEDIKRSVHELSLVALRSVFGHRLMQECITEREELAQEIESIVAEKASEWGIKINLMEITDVILPPNLEQSLASAATAEREGRAKIIMAKADVESAKLMRQASDILATPGAMQIRMLEAYNKLADLPNPKIVFMPLDGLSIGEESK